MRKYKGDDMKFRLLFSSSLLGLLALLAIPAQLAAQERSRDEHAPLRYTVTDLGVVGPTPGQAYAVNRSGLIGGAAVAPDGAMHAVLWYNRLKLDIGKRGLGGANSVALDLNDWGQTVGEAETSTPDPNGEDFCGFKTLGFPSSGTCLPFFW
jgi:hypothetical protein